MGRKPNNPDLVDELVKKRWSMSDNKFEEKYNSLSSDDKSKITEVINNMEDELLERCSTGHFEKYSGYDDWKNNH